MGNVYWIVRVLGAPDTVWYLAESRGSGQVWFCVCIDSLIGGGLGIWKGTLEEWLQG